MINSCARNSGKMLDATRTKYGVSLRVHNTSARIVDMYFDANSAPRQRFLEILKDENHSIKIKIYYRCEFGYEMCTRGTCGAGRGTEIELLDTDPKSSGH